MNLVDWQQRYEHWILTHHAQDDAAHDLSADFAGPCRLRPPRPAPSLLDPGPDLEKQGLFIAPIPDMGTVV